jgi:hypothetical protein
LDTSSIQPGFSFAGPVKYLWLIMPRASQEYNLYLLKPNLIMEWHPTKNGSNIGPEISDMKSGADFRKDKRFMFQDTVILENQNSGQWVYARSVNISGVGLFFESEISFDRGTRIIIQFNNPPFKSTQKTYPSIVR